MRAARKAQMTWNEGKAAAEESSPRSQASSLPNSVWGTNDRGGAIKGRARNRGNTTAMETQRDKKNPCVGAGVNCFGPLHDGKTVLEGKKRRHGVARDSQRDGRLVKDEPGQQHEQIATKAVSKQRVYSAVRRQAH